MSYNCDSLSISCERKQLIPTLQKNYSPDPNGRTWEEKCSRIFPQQQPSQHQQPSQQQQLVVFAVASKPMTYYGMLVATAIKYNFKLVTIGWITTTTQKRKIPPEYYFGYKIVSVYNILVNCMTRNFINNNTIVMVVDGTDVMFQNGPEEILKQFEMMNRSIIFGGEAPKNIRTDFTERKYQQQIQDSLRKRSNAAAVSGPRAVSGAVSGPRGVSGNVSGTAVSGAVSGPRGVSGNVSGTAVSGAVSGPRGVSGNVSGTAVSGAGVGSGAGAVSGARAGAVSGPRGVVGSGGVSGAGSQGKKYIPDMMTKSSLRPPEMQFMFLNSGCFIGRVGSLLEFYRLWVNPPYFKINKLKKGGLVLAKTQPPRVILPIQTLWEARNKLNFSSHWPDVYFRRDQFTAIHMYLDGVGDSGVDTQGKIFLSTFMGGAAGLEYYLLPNAGSVRNQTGSGAGTGMGTGTGTRMTISIRTNTIPSVLHFAGASKYLQCLSRYVKTFMEEKELDDLFSSSSSSWKDQLVMLDANLDLVSSSLVTSNLIKTWVPRYPMRC
jgi:hypothetical protein